MSDFPFQPIDVVDGVTRFRGNQLVRRLLDHGHATGLGLNELAGIKFPREDWVQFAQLIGYSLGGFNDLSYVTPFDSDRAEAAAKADKDPRDELIHTLETQLKDLRDSLRDGIARLYNKHPDDLRNDEWEEE